MIWENGIETWIISYKKRITSPGLMQDTLGYMQDTPVGLVHWDDPEGWYGEGRGRGVLDWEDPLEEGMATHSSILAWRTSWNTKSSGP